MKSHHRRAAGRHRGHPDRRSAADRRRVGLGIRQDASSRRSPSCWSVSFLSLGWRTGIVVALSVPLVLAIVLRRHVRAPGIDLHRITLGALIIALGLLVDDAIIAIEMMVVKMEQGWDRVRAATFAWTSTAFPMLTGTLVTAAGFLPVGFAKSSAGEYAGGIFWVVGLALIASWFVAVVFTPYLGLKLLPDFAKHGAHAQSRCDLRHPHLPRAAPLDRAVPCAGARPSSPPRWSCSSPRIAGFGLVQQQFFPTSTRPSCSSRCGCPEGTAIGVTDDGREEGREPACRRSRHRHLHHLCRPGLAALLARAQSGAAEPEFRPDRHRHQGPRGARARQGPARKGACRRRACRGADPGRPLRVRSAGRLPGAVPRHRPRSDEGARDRRAGARSDGGKPQDRRPASRLERAGQVDPPRGRPGPRPRARADAAGRGADAADAALGLHRHAISRGHRAYRRGGARGSDRAARARPAAGADHHHAKRRRRCRCRRSRGSITSSRSRSCGGATATSC